MIGLSKTRTRLFLLLSVLVVGFCGWALYSKLTYVKEDLGPLQERASTLSYNALIRAVQAKPAPAEGFTFVALGDTRNILDLTKMPPDDPRGNMALAREVLTKAASESPSFIIHTGDLVRKGTVDEYVRYHFPLMDGIAPLPVIPVPGNHEKGPNRDFAGFRAIYGDERFSFDYGDCRFVGVNDGDSGGLSADDLRFLEQELSKPGAKRKFVVMHIPPRFAENMQSDGDAANDEEGRGFTRNEKALRELMRRMKVDEVFLGHDHAYLSQVVDGVRYTITGGGGARLSDVLGAEAKFHHYVVVHVTPEGVRGEVVKMTDDDWTRSEVR